jgi:drug/metabolite transporter (DMT)-like permease
MSVTVFLAVLFAALLHASWNALIKISGDRLVIMAVTTGSASILVIPALFILPLPDQASWGYLLLSALIHSFYMLLLVRAYGLGDFAQVYPVARGSAPLLTALMGFVLLGETMSLLEIAGMCLIVAGILALALEYSGGMRQLSHAALIFSLLVGLCISAYSIVDGTGARLAGNSNSYTAWMFFLDGFAVPIYALLRRPLPKLRESIANVWVSGLCVAALSTLGYWLIIWAFTQERIAPVAVLRETSVLFALLISIFLIGERFSRLRVLVTALILAGIVLLGT